MSTAKSIDKLLTVGKPIVVPAPPPFAGVDSEAHNWNVNLAAKYVTEVLELPHIAEQFKLGDMNGHSLICLDEDHINNLKIDNLLQKLKIVSHAQMLKTKVFEKAAIQKPSSFINWTSVHVAAWLTYKQSSPKAGMNVLRAKVDGKHLAEMKEDKLLKLLSNDGASSKEANQALTAIQKAVEDASAKQAAEEATVLPPTAPTADEEEENHKKGKGKKKSGTRMSKRKATAAAAALAMDDSEEEDAPPVSNKIPPASAVPSSGQLKASTATGVPHILSAVKEEPSREVNDEEEEEELHIVKSKPASESKQQPPPKKGDDKVQLNDLTDADEEANVLDETAGGKKHSKKTKKLKTKQQIAAAAHLEAQKTIEASIADFAAGRVPPEGSMGTMMSLQDTYSSSNERREFLEKIAGLRKTVEEHTATMNQMHQYASRLREENEQYQREQRQLLMENSTNKNVIHNLVKDRNTAVSELQQVVKLYESAAQHEKQLLSREIAAMTDSRQQLKQDNSDLTLTNGLNRVSLQQSHNATLGATYQYAPLNLSSAAVPGAVPSAGVGGVPSVQRDDEDSDLEDGRPGNGAVGPAGTTKSVGATVDGSAAPSSFAASVAAVSGVSAAGSTNPAVTLLPAATVIAGNATVPSSSSAPSVSAASSTKPGPGGVAVAAGPSGASAGISLTDKPLVKEINFMGMVDATAHAESSLWQSIVQTYSYASKSSLRTTKGGGGGGGSVAAAASASDVISSTASVEDTHTLLSKIAILWTRLGLKMLDDAHSPKTEPETAKALRGLEKCARRSMLEFRDSMSSSANKANERTAAVGAGNHSPARTKKFQLTSTSNSLHATVTSMAAADKLDYKVNHSEVCLCCCPVYQTVNQQPVAQSKPQLQYCVAVGMVFAMGLAQRILEKYPKEEDQTNLLSLLNLLKFGDLPMTELSRENLRDLLIYNLGIDLPWDRFNSVCQRVDPERKGFISSPGLLRAFQLLTPLLSSSVTASAAAPLTNSIDRKQLETQQSAMRLSSHKDVLFVNLFSLTCSVATLTADKREITETFIDIISGNSKRHSSGGGRNIPASFSKFIAKERSKYSGDGKLSSSLSKMSLLSGGAGGAEDIRILDEQSLVSDILRETSRDLVGSLLDTQQRDWRSLNDGYRKQRLCEEHPHHLSHHLSSYQVPVEYFVHNHSEVTHQTAKNYQIYDNEPDGMKQQQGPVGVLSALSSLVVSFLCFRRICIKVLMSGSAAGTSTGLSQDDLNELLLDCERSLLALLGDRLQTQQLVERSDATPLAMLEGQMCEVLGIPVPCSCCCFSTSSSSSSNSGRCAPGSCGLIAAQCRVEVALSQTQQYLRYENSVLLNSEELLPPAKKAQLATSQALKDIQQQIHLTLWPDDKGGVVNGGSDRLSKLKSLRNGSHQAEDGTVLEDESDNGSPTTKTQLHVSDLQVVQEANTLMHQQRVEQTTRYLDYLNSKAARKKKILMALVSLWKSTKIALGHRNAVNSLSATQEAREQMRLFAMPVEDILTQTKQVQKVLIDDMQKENSTKTSQLMERINLLRAGILNNSICDEDQSLVEALREISTLENGLLQANADAMKLANKILTQLGGGGSSSSGAVA